MDSPSSAEMKVTVELRVPRAILEQEATEETENGVSLC